MSCSISLLRFSHLLQLKRQFFVRSVDLLVGGSWLLDEKFNDGVGSLVTEQLATAYLDMQPTVEINFFAFNLLQFVNKIKDFIIACIFSGVMMSIVVMAIPVC
jgi:hypothetical protein